MTSTSASRSTPGRVADDQRLGDRRGVGGRDGVVDELDRLARGRAGRRGRSARPSPRSSGRARAKSAASPPAMIVSVPSSALGDEPVTGASTKRIAALGERSRRSRGRRRARSSTCRRTACPRRRRDAPSSPSSIASTCGAVDDHRDDDLGARGGLGRRGGDRRAVLGAHASAFSARAVPDRQLVAGPAQVRGLREPMIPRPSQATFIAPSPAAWSPC